MDAVIYVHGKNGSAEEAGHYQPLFASCRVVGLDYSGSMPWEVGTEIRKAVADLKETHEKIILIANSVGAYYTLVAGIGKSIAHAYFISPVVDMERLILDRMRRSGVTEAQLQKRGVVPTDFGEDLSWEYLCYVKEHPVTWKVPTEILYGSRDELTPIDTIKAFAKKHRARLTVMENGEHWFHTDAQMRFLDRWIRENPAR